MSSPFSQKNFLIGFIASCVLCGALYAYVIHSFGFSKTIAIKDAGVGLSIWILGSILLGNTLRYYLPEQSKFIFLGGFVVTLTLIWIAVTSFILLKWLQKYPGYRDFYFQSITVRIAFSFLIFTAVGLIFAFVFTLQNKQLTEKRNAEAIQLAKDAELNNLQEKLQPHFLFNSLNSINALVMVQPERARQMVQQLSDFLRGTLKRESNGLISLKNELEYLELYFDIEKVRFGHRLQTSISIAEGAEKCMLPTFILLPVLENAVKFGLYDTLDEIQIELIAKVSGGMLEVSITNPFDAATSGQNKGTGFGLKSVARRLNLLFERNDLLKTTITNKIFTTTVLIPQLQHEGRNNR